MSEERDRLTSPILEWGQAATVCRCGAHFPLGFVGVRLGGVIVTISLTADGSKWPFEVVVPAELKQRLAPTSEREFLPILAERWESHRLHDHQSALREARS